ncbi:MAG TPA: OsmC family protein [Candidatus Baltobacteraceae bacterium]|nr:OsmC family protein [Candidatus Baltobacteraceae bacterium]
MIVKKAHAYQTELHWNAHDGDGTTSYRSYSRNHSLRSGDKAIIEGSSDPAFRGDASRYNPEELLVLSLSSCHMLWYLHLCSVNGIVVTEYRDEASGEMAENADGSGQFAKVVLRPVVTLRAGSDEGKARELHHQAHEMCFIARSVNFPVECHPGHVEGRP